MKSKHYCLEGILHDARCNCKCLSCEKHFIAYNKFELDEALIQRMRRQKKEWDRQFKFNRLKAKLNQPIVWNCCSSATDCKCGLQVFVTQQEVKNKEQLFNIDKSKVDLPGVTDIDDEMSFMQASELALDHCVDIKDENIITKVINKIRAGIYKL